MFQIIIKEMKEFLRDKMNLFFFMLFPIVLVFLLGNLLVSMDTSEEPIGEIKVHYEIETKNLQDTVAINTFIKEINNNKNIQFEEIKDTEASKQLAGEDKITAVIVFEGDPMKISIYEGTNPVKNRTVNAIMNGFAYSNQAISSVIKLAPDTLTDMNNMGHEWTKQKDLGVKRSMLDYYAITMLAMISFMSIIVGAGAFVGERQNKTINRLILSPKNRISIFFQIIIGMLPQALIQNAVLMIISVFIFKAHYAVNLMSNLYLFGMFFIVTFTMISIGALIGLLIKANPTAVTMPVLWFMMFFGGTYSKEMYIKGVTEAMPIYKLQQAAFDVTIFGRYDKANRFLIVCVILSLIALAVSALIFYRKEEER